MFSLFCFDFYNLIPYIAIHKMVYYMVYLVYIYTWYTFQIIIGILVQRIIHNILYIFINGEYRNNVYKVLSWKRTDKQKFALTSFIEFRYIKYEKIFCTVHYLSSTLNEYQIVDFFYKHLVWL